MVRRGTFTDRFLLTGELAAVRSDNIVVPRTPAWQVPIRWMEADGATVAQGQKVLELDNSQFSGELEQKRLAAEKAANDLLRRKAEIEGTLAEKEFDVERRRIEVEKAQLEANIPEQLRPQREYQEKQLALARAQVEQRKARETLQATRQASAAQLEELNIALERARDEIGTAEQAIGALTLLAPRDGILVVAENGREGRKFQIGDSVWVGLPVMSMPDLTTMKVVANLSDVDDGRISLGATARCTLDAYPERSFAGRVIEISPIAQEENNRSLRRFFRAVIQLEESDPERMRPGMSVRAELALPPLEQVLIAPRRSLDLTTDPPRARLADGTTADVRLGVCDPAECVIEEGLAEGTRLSGVAG